MVLDRLSPDAWIENGSKSSSVRARERAQNILQNHKPVPLTTKVGNALEDEMKQILKECSLKPSNLPSF
jgi:trimethylamine:corrinoid methyltransferase-like protein